MRWQAGGTKEFSIKESRKRAVSGLNQMHVESCKGCNITNNSYLSVKGVPDKVKDQLMLRRSLQYPYGIIQCKVRQTLEALLGTSHKHKILGDRAVSTANIRHRLITFSHLGIIQDNSIGEVKIDTYYV